MRNPKVQHLTPNQEHLLFLAERQLARSRILQLGARELIKAEFPTDAELVETTDAIKEALSIRQDAYSMRTEATQEKPVPTSSQRRLARQAKKGATK